MKEYFNINLEFDHAALEETVTLLSRSNQKGYVCFVDLTSLVYSYEHCDFRVVLNNAVSNSCDGSYIAMFASKIHRQKLVQYIGPDFFEKFIFKEEKHIILGSNIRVFNKVINRIELQRGGRSSINYVELPIRDVDDFDYKGIASKINSYNANFIWVSLGAPKQEYFMSKLLPYINRGVMLGVGAALNYFSGEINEIPNWMKKIHLVWVYRLLTEPRKQFKRLKSIFIIFPRMIMEESNKKCK